MGRYAQPVPDVSTEIMTVLPNPFILIFIHLLNVTCLSFTCHSWQGIQPPGRFPSLPFCWRFPGTGALEVPAALVKGEALGVALGLSV